GHDMTSRIVGCDHEILRRSNAREIISVRRGETDHEQRTTWRGADCLCAFHGCSACEALQCLGSRSPEGEPKPQRHLCPVESVGSNWLSGRSLLRGYASVNQGSECGSQRFAPINEVASTCVATEPRDQIQQPLDG